MRDALIKAGVPCVLTGGASVFNTRGGDGLAADAGRPGAAPPARGWFGWPR